MNTITRSIALAAALLAGTAHAQAVKVEGAWARASVQGQSGTGAFMKITAAERQTLLGVSSPVAGVAEVHEMKLEGDVMRMRPVASLDLPAGTPVELKPGGYHVMLLDLKAPLVPGTSVPLTLLLRGAGGAQTRLEVTVPVSVRPPAGAHKH